MRSASAFDVYLFGELLVGALLRHVSFINVSLWQGSTGSVGPVKISLGLAFREFSTGPSTRGETKPIEHCRPRHHFGRQLRMGCAGIVGPVACPGGLTLLPFILLLLVLLWSPPLGLAILLALLLAEGLADMDLYKLSVADALDSLSSYESPDEIDADSIACLRETLNRIARDYYMAVYGASLSPTQRRLCRWLAALLFAVAAAIAWSVLVGASEPGQTLLFVAGLIGSALSLIFFWSRRALDKSLGIDNRNTLRWIQASRITKAAGIDGPHEFMQKVRGLYTGHLACNAGHAACDAGYPQLTAQFLVPYHKSTTFYALVVFTSLTMFLLRLVQARWPATQWASVLANPHHFLVIVLDVVDIVSTVYLAGLMFLNSSEWPATQLGGRYFPLQVMCHDLSFLGLTSPGAGSACTAVLDARKPAPPRGAF